MARASSRALFLVLTAAVAGAIEGDRYVSLRLGATPAGGTLSIASKDLFGTHMIDNWGAELVRADPDAYDVVFHDTDADLFVRLDTPAGSSCLLHLDANPLEPAPVVEVFQTRGLECRVERSRSQRSHWTVLAQQMANHTCDWNGTHCVAPAQVPRLNHPIGGEAAVVVVGNAPTGTKLSAATTDLFGTHSVSNYGSEVDRQSSRRFAITFDDSDGSAFLRLDIPQGGSCLLLVDANPVGPKPMAIIFQMSGLKCDVVQKAGTWSIDAEAAEGYRCDWNSFRCATPEAVLRQAQSDEEATVVVRAATTGTKLSAATQDLFGTHFVPSYGSQVTRRTDQWFEIAFDDSDGSAFLRLDASGGGSCLLLVDANPVGAHVRAVVFQMSGLKCEVVGAKGTWSVVAAPADGYRCDWDSYRCAAPQAHPVRANGDEHAVVAVAAAASGSKLSVATKDLFGTHSVSNYGSVVDRQTSQRVEITFQDTDGSAFLRLDVPAGGNCLLLVDADPVGSSPWATVFQMSGLKCAVKRAGGIWLTDAVPAKGYHCDWDSTRCAEGALMV